MTTRPQWLTVHTPDGEDVKMRLPANPSVQEVQTMLKQVAALAAKHRRSNRPERIMRGWSLTQGPARVS